MVHMHEEIREKWLARFCLVIVKTLGRVSQGKKRG